MELRRVVHRPTFNDTIFRWSGSETRLGRKTVDAII